jgi:hypothetical protein
LWPTSSVCLGEAADERDLSHRLSLRLGRDVTWAEAVREMLLARLAAEEAAITEEE